MMESIKRMGVAYGKLGLSTDPALIGRRTEGVKAAAGKLELDGIAPLVQAVFDVGSGDARFAFLSNFGGDPTFGVQPTDREALLLAGAVAEYEIENETEISPELALAVVAGSCGGLRQPPLNDHLVSVARHYLAQFQGQDAARPEERTYVEKPQEVTDAIGALSSGGGQYFNQAEPRVTAALNAVSDYVESVATSAAESDGEVLDYIRSLEEEMRTYWWVTGGWSEDANGLFSRLSLAVAAIAAGKELAGKHSNPVGLFAAPALIGLILERGRSDSTAEIVLQDAAVAPSRDWRKKHFAQAASGPLAAILPVTAVLGLSAASEDADDWKPRFNRLTGLEPDATLPASELGVQLYRERLVARALGNG